MINVTPFSSDFNHHDRPEIGVDVELPANLDPARCPIIAEHFFGWRPIGAVAAQAVQALAYRRKIKRFVAKGERTVGEMLAEVIARYDLGVEINDLLDRYTDIPDDHLDLTGGRDFPPPPLHVVER